MWYDCGMTTTYERHTDNATIRIVTNDDGTWVEVRRGDLVEYLHSPETSGLKRVFRLVQRIAPASVPMGVLMRRTRDYPVNSFVRFA